MRFVVFGFCIFFMLISCKENETLRSFVTKEVLSDSLESFFHEPNSGNTVFTDVNVIDMKSGNVTHGADVFIADGLIENITTTGTQSYDKYNLVPGGGKYLIPGLSDMHTHLIPDQNLPYDLFLFLARGVTRIRIMWGFLYHIAVRDSINQGLLVGPDVYVASAGFDGQNTTWPGAVNTSSPEDIRAYVDAYKEAGFDFIKVYSGLPREEFLELISYALELNIPPVGHVPSGVDYFDAVDAGQKTVEHFNNFNSSRFGQQKLVSKLIEKNAFNCPTISVVNRITSTIPQFRDDPWFDYVSPEGKDFFYDTERTIPRSNFVLERNMALTREVSSAGARIIAGTDTGIRYVLPGISIHEELEHYTHAGLSNYDALKTATVNVSDFLDQELSGTITIGAPADLVLLNANPLDDITNTKDIAGVLKGGQWMSAEAISKILELIRTYHLSK